MFVSLFLSIACSVKQTPIETTQTKTESAPRSVTQESQPSSNILVPHTLQTNLMSDYEAITSPLTLRARKLIIPDGGVVEQHNHDTRLGYAYITSGEISEHRIDADPILRTKGAFISETVTLSHFWTNNSGAPVRAIVFDILPPSAELAPTPQRESTLQGPQESVGVKSVELLNTLDLDSVYPELHGKQLRARLFTLEPSAIIGQHSHQERSGYVYVVSGEIVETRNDQNKSLTRRAGDIILEENGVEHYWENQSSAEVELLSVDIFTPPVE